MSRIKLITQRLLFYMAKDPVDKVKKANNSMCL